MFALVKAVLQPFDITAKAPIRRIFIQTGDIYISFYIFLESIKNLMLAALTLQIQK